jgi:hypothetical protein
MSDLIIGPLGTPWVTQATWVGATPREVLRRRRENDRDRRNRRRNG